METTTSFPFSSHALDGKFTREDILTALKICPYTSYRIGAETGITQASIQNYRTGRSKPSAQIARTLATYLRLSEYVTEHKSDMDYLHFLEKYGVNPLVDPKPSTIGYVDGYIPKKTNVDAATLESGPSWIASETETHIEAHEYESALEATGDEINALHALVLAQMKKMELQRCEIIRLKKVIKELEARQI